MTALAAGLLNAAQVNADSVDLTMYYPVSVGGALTDVVDNLVEEFESEHPDINVEAIYAGNYDDTRVRAMSAIEAGDTPQLSVLFSIDLYELIEQNAIVAFDNLIETDEEQEWLDSFYPELGRDGRNGRHRARSIWRRAVGRDGAFHWLPLLDVPGLRVSEWPSPDERRWY